MAQLIDLTGQIFTRWTVLRKATNNICGLTAWECQCSCGNIKSIIGNSLKQGKSKSCGCLSRDSGKESLVGLTFGRLKVLAFLYNKSGCLYWKCFCTCGTVKPISGYALKSGNTTSCGCLNREITSLRSTKNLLNQVFTKLTVIKKESARKSGRVCWLCKCACGNFLTVTSHDLLREHTKSCGCLNKEVQQKRHREYRIAKGKDPDKLLTTERQGLRGTISNSGIKQKILHRDKFSCVLCGKTKLQLHVHHIVPISKNDLLAMEETNLICLCKGCHEYAHGKSNKTINILIQSLLLKIISFTPL